MRSALIPTTGWPWSAASAACRTRSAVLDVLAGRDTADEAERVIDAIATLPNLVQVRDRDSDEIQRHGLYGGLEVRLIVVPPETWGSALVWYTGSRAHVARLEELARADGWRLSPFGLEVNATGQLLEREREAAIYERLGLAWVPPELREDDGEIEAAESGRPSRAGRVELIFAGDLHNPHETGPTAPTHSRTWPRRPNPGATSTWP